MSSSAAKPQRRAVNTELIETTPSASAIGYWILASPFLLFLLWMWGDLFAHYSPLPWLVDWVLGILLFFLVIVLPLGLLAHWAVTSLPRIFHHAGWDLRFLEPVRAEEQYMVKPVYTSRIRAETSWPRTLMRAAQGWVYLEIGAIFVGAVAMIPLFLSATEFGFGR